MTSYTTLFWQNPDSEAAIKKAKAEALRAAEKFMVIGAGTATCKSCGYDYKPEKGDPDFPIPKGMKFQVRMILRLYLGITLQTTEGF